MRASVILTIAITCSSSGLACAAENIGISVGETVFAIPQSLSVFYSFPGPLKSARVTLQKSEGLLSSLDVQFGNGKKVEIPASILRCFNRPSMQESFFLVSKPGASYPKVSDRWWAAIAVPFSYAIAPGDPREDEVSVSIFPYVQFVLSNWKLTGIRLRHSDDFVEDIPLPFQGCSSIPTSAPVNGK